jgi:hypothetical protein
MKILKNEILLSPLHPSMLLSLQPQSILYAPLVIDQNRNLIDGYRRFQLLQDDLIEVTQLSAENIFMAAYEMNLRSRSWDDVDCFLWRRWAQSIGGDAERLPLKRQSPVLESVSTGMLTLLAERKITIRQAVLIQEAPPAAHEYLLKLLSEVIQLNDNETAEFIRMAWDVKIKEKIAGLKALLETDRFLVILQDRRYSPKQAGEALLKELRAVRYPLYQKKLEQFTSDWQQLNLGRGIQVKGNSFVERGILEISFASKSLNELKAHINQLSDSLASPEWIRIFEE